MIPDRATVWADGRMEVWKCGLRLLFFVCVCVCVLCVCVCVCACALLVGLGVAP